MKRRKGKWEKSGEVRRKQKRKFNNVTKLILFCCKIELLKSAFLLIFEKKPTFY